ncbi:MAG: type II toxin-antitoxin system VapC family toxin [Cyclobacteriaceae bacterium]|nr:type II toxin-antitoxin system VapC family toxin [Cyclobacteriaceae bacterium]
MNFLIDTHVLLWYMQGDHRLSKVIISQIESDRNNIFISKASLWEIAIKVGLGKLKVETPLTELGSYLSDKKISILDFSFPDLQKITELEFYHRDPFDRLIISQAINNNLTVITDDKKFNFYPVQLLQ